MKFFTENFFSQLNSQEVILLPHTPIDPNAEEHLFQHEPMVAGHEFFAFRQYNFFRARAYELLCGADPMSGETASDCLEKQLLIRNIIAAANTRLVETVVRGLICGRKFSLDDFRGYAHVKLLKCIPQFDYLRGLKFSTYALLALKRYMYTELRVQSRNQLLTEYKSPRGDVVTKPIIYSTELQVKYSTPTLEPRLPDGDTKVLEAMAKLPPRSREILRARFDFNGKTETLKELGRRMGLTSERVRQIEAKSLKAMKKMLEPA